MAALLSDRIETHSLSQESIAEHMQAGLDDFTDEQISEQITELVYVEYKFLILSIIFTFSFFYSILLSKLLLFKQTETICFVNLSNIFFVYDPNKLSTFQAVSFYNHQHSTYIVKS